MKNVNVMVKEKIITRVMVENSITIAVITKKQEKKRELWKFEVATLKVYNLKDDQYIDFR